jgi:hypothetical protein
MGEVPTAVGGAKKVGRYFKRGELSKQLYDDPVPAQHLSKTLNLKSFDQLLAKGENWVRALRDMNPGKEAGERFGEGMDNLYDAVKKYSVEKARSIQKAFQDKLKVPYNPRGNAKYTEAMYAEFKRVRQESLDALNEGRQLLGGMRKTRRLQSQVYGPGGRLKQGPTAIEARDLLNTTKEAIRSKLGSFHPMMRDTYDALNDEYALFASLRDLADNPKAITPDGRHVNLDAIARQMDETPRRLQSRMSDEWNSIKDIMRRGAPTSEGFDQPGWAGRLRMMMYGTRGHAAASGEAAGAALGGAPMVGKPVGTVPGLLPKQPKVRPGYVPRLIFGGAANEAAEQRRQNAVREGLQ